MGSSPLSGVSFAYLDALQDAYARDPGSVEPSWRALFQILAEVEGGLPVRPRAGEGTEDDAPAWRERGHLEADLDPLDARAAGGAPGSLRRAYTGTLSAETAHIDDAACRAWLRAAVERGDGLPEPAAARDIARGLIEAEEFEAFLAKKFPTKKRFGAEGAEAVVPLLRRLLAGAAAAGIERVVIGTMHRGRLSIAANVLGRPLARMLAELKDAHPFPADPPRAADVPYHLGHETRLTFGAHALDVVLLPNPSHLEAVDAVALGRARAEQDRIGAGGAARVLPLILHTDAAVVGQGVVAECIQLAGTSGYGTGGALHVVIDNRIGFTTEPRAARTSRHCTGPWKAVDSAILHVNGDDPEAACRAADIALAWRQAQARDAVIDLHCYRRNGHNEIDEPGFTQPLLYARIADHPGVRARYCAALVDRGLAAASDLDAIARGYRAGLQAAYDAAGGARANASGYAPRPPAHAAGSGLARERLEAIAAALATPPAGASLHPRMGRILRQRPVEEAGIAWPAAEALAFGGLVLDGVPVRLSGQDVVRGAFSHRHLALFDAGTGRGIVGLDGLAPDQARFEAHDSPLSEYAVLGFEYGYSLGRPEALVIWEAQFGDFANGAQIVVDQFVAAAEEKWCGASRLVLLLPHGLEGQGPEHSSARIERYLQLAARDNLRIAQPSTPANYFHLLREQGLGHHDRPLVVIGPKKLLRLPAAVSPPADFLPGTAFRPVLAAPPDGAAELVLVCSGKIAYDLAEERQARGARGVAILRLERLYPLPEEALAGWLGRWPGARLAWVQEEPENMGAWAWLDRRLERIAAAAGLAEPRPVYVGRPESPSPAGSSHLDHEADQRALVRRAFEAARRPAAVVPMHARGGRSRA